MACNEKLSSESHGCGAVERGAAVAKLLTWSLDAV
jgi:hypothetical protein